MTTEITEYSPTETALAQLRETYAGATFEVTTTAGMKLAIAARAELRDYRINLEKMRKTIKEPALRRCDRMLPRPMHVVLHRRKPVADDGDTTVAVAAQRTGAHQVVPSPSHS